MKRPTKPTWGDKMKLHLHRLRVDGLDCSIFTLRPGLEVSWSTNFYHGTWHILGNMRSAKVLAHLMWGLSYQRSSACFVFIDRSYIQPNPFDAEPSDTILIGLRTPHRDLLHRLKKPLGPSEGTVRWRTFGLANHAFTDYVPTFRAMTRRSLRVQRSRGTLVLHGPRTALRDDSVVINGMKTRRTADIAANMDYRELGDGPFFCDGEVQIFNDYRARLARAKATRAKVLSTANAPTDPETLRRVIYAWQA